MNSANQKEKSRSIFDESKMTRADEILNTIDSNLNSLLFQGTPKDFSEKRAEKYFIPGRKKNSLMGSSDFKESEQPQGGIKFSAGEKFDWGLISGKEGRENDYDGESPSKKEFINIIEHEETSKRLEERANDFSSLDIHENLRLKNKIETLERDNRKKGQELKETRHQLDSILNKEIQTNRQTLSASSKKKYSTQTGGDLFTDNSNILSRMEKLEEFYKNKIKIVEERKKELEEDVQRLENEKHMLINMNEEAKRKMQKYIEEMEEGYKRELLEQISRLEEQMASQVNQLMREKKEAEENASSKIHALRRDLETQNRQVEELQAKLTEISEINRVLEEEKLEANEKYNQLMMIHNNMIELDLKKNEKTLLNSKTPFAQRSQLLAASQNEQSLALMSGTQEQPRSGMSAAQSEELLGVLNYYKSEIEKIKDYNEKIKAQYFTDMGEMKKILKRKDREQEVLKTELRAMKNDY